MRDGVSCVAELEGEAAFGYGQVSFQVTILRRRLSLGYHPLEKSEFQTRPLSETERNSRAKSKWLLTIQTCTEIVRIDYHTKSDYM